MNQERLRHLVMTALEQSVGESVAPSVSMESNTGGGRVEIPLAFADHFAQLILMEKTNGATKSS
jgi:hypothetical protein